MSISYPGSSPNPAPGTTFLAARRPSVIAMSWTETHKRWTALREVRVEIERNGELPWSAELAEVFHTPHELALALQYFWTLTLAARVDDAVEMDGAGAAQLAGRRFADQNAGLQRVLEQHFVSLAAVERQIVADFGGHAYARTPA